MMKQDDETLSDEYIDNTIKRTDEGMWHPFADLLAAFRELRARRDAERLPTTYPKLPEVCEHLDFAFHVEVARVLAEEGGPVAFFNVHLRMTCKGCGVPFSFEGLPRGIDLKEPMAGAMGIEARLPTHPLREDDKRGETMRVVVPDGLEERKELQAALGEALRLARIRLDPDDRSDDATLQAEYPTLWRCLARMSGEVPFDDVAFSRWKAGEA